MTSQIEKIVMDISENQIDIPLDEFKEEDDKFGRCYEALENRINDDKGLKRLFTEFYNANDILHHVMLTKYYREGFKCGARVALEIIGWKKSED